MIWKVVSTVISLPGRQGFLVGTGLQPLPPSCMFFVVLCRLKVGMRVSAAPYSGFISPCLLTQSPVPFPPLLTCVGQACCVVESGSLQYDVVPWECGPYTVLLFLQLDDLGVQLVEGG